MFTFQCLDCYIQDTNIDAGTGNFDETQDETINDKKFTCHMFGKTKTGESVTVNVVDYTPYLYIQYSPEFNTDYWHQEFFQLLQDQLIQWKVEDDSFTVSLDSSDHLINEDYHLYKNMWGYNFSKESKFFKICFKSLLAYRKIKSILTTCHSNPLSDKQVLDFFENVSDLVYKDQYPFMKNYSKSFLHEFCQNGKLCEDCKTKQFAVITLLRFIIKLGKKKLPFQLINFKLYDVIDPILRFTHEKDLKIASWVNIENWTIEEKLTTSDIEYTASYHDISPCKDDDTICNSIKEMAFDIETYSPTDCFTNASNESDKVYQIGITLKDYTDKQAKRILLHLADTGTINALPVTEICIRGNENTLDLCKNKTCLKIGHEISKVQVTVENFTTERDLLLRFQKIIEENDPDLIYGYNSDGFDWRYLMTRAEITGCFQEFCRLSRLKDYNCKVVEKKFSSSAYGDNSYYRVDIPGRLNIDLMIWIQRNMPVNRYADYKLDTVAEMEISQKKHDVSFKEIFRAYREGDSDLLTKVGDYCIQDTILVQKLVNKLDVVTQLFEMSNLTSVPVSYLLSRGQQIKCFSIISKDAMIKNFLVPFQDIKDDSSFTGAIVLEPKRGFFDTPIAVLDFASLYPSIQVAHKICYSTIVLDPVLQDTLQKMKLSGQELIINDTLFDFIEWDDNVVEYKGTFYSSVDNAKESLGIPKKDIVQSISNRDGIFKESKRHYLFFFAQNKDSIIPDLQVELKQTRSKVKRMMGEIENSDNSEDKLRYRVLNGRQLAIKVTMNSIYGFTSAFMLNMSSLSACVTGRGRQMIEMTRHFMENEFETIAKNNFWTRQDTMTYYTHTMKQVVTDTPEKGWIRKFPSAIEHQSWTNKSLAINVVGGDTDSVFCNFPNSTLQETISLNHKAEEILTDKVFNRKPIEMEYEKTYCPMVIIKKKNYIGIKYEMNPDKFKIDYKGIAIKKRNYCNKVKEIYWNIIYPILGIQLTPDGKYKKMPDLGPSVALKVLADDLQTLVDLDLNLMTRADYSAFIVSASLKSSYKSENLPHVQLAKRMEERDSSSAPRSGQRFGYVIVNEDCRGEELYAKSEDPTFAFENKLPLDMLYYLNNQIRKPIITFLESTGRINEIEAIFNNIQDQMFNKLKKTRQQLELHNRMNFFDTTQKRKQVVPLKPPKKKRIKENNNTSIKDFFKLA